MHARHIDGITIRPLRHGDTTTVATLFARLGARSREQRFCGAKPRIAAHELEALARVDGDHHVLVAFVDSDPTPAGMARLVRSGRSAEIAFEVADAHQGRGIGSLLAQSSPRTRVPQASPSWSRRCAATTRPSSRSAPRRRLAPRLWRGREREFVLGLEG
jgi:GNAT superfamily N-acetyltransferase